MMNGTATLIPAVTQKFTRPSPKRNGRKSLFLNSQRNAEYVFFSDCSLNEVVFAALNIRAIPHKERTAKRSGKGTIVDSTLIAAPSSTKNKEKQRDPEAHSVKKGNQWYFGYKEHIGVDADSGLVHTVETTAAILY